MDNYGVLKLYEKVADDMAEAQLADGLVPGIAPEYVAFVNAKRRQHQLPRLPRMGERQHPVPVASL